MTCQRVCKPPLGTNSHYLMNQPGLQPQHLTRLPLGSVEAAGWLKGQLSLMVDGMVGRLDELSRFLSEENGWFGGDNPGWEEQAYWFRGFHDLAVLTGDERLLTIAQRWIEAVLESQDEDGYFGASYHKSVPSEAHARPQDYWPATSDEFAARNSSPREHAAGETCVDIWPHMVMLDAIISHHEHSGDERVIPFMRRFFRFCAAIPDEQFMPLRSADRFASWKVSVQTNRAADMLPHIYWLYNRTGVAWLLELADRFCDAVSPPESEWLDHHVVNLAQRVGYPGSYYQRAGVKDLLARGEYYYQQFIGTWGQQPRGAYAADERIRPGKVDPRQGIETCAMVELAKTWYHLGETTGDALYADRTEDIMLNHFPAAQTPDLKALHYITASNQPQLDAGENHDLYNRGRQVCYSPWIYRCCQHNVAMGWPWYVRNLWKASADNGLVAWMYGASTVRATVNKGVEVTVDQESDYPFDGAVRLTLHTESAVAFPLYLRVPGWCAEPVVSINGQDCELTGQGGYIRVERTWSDGDCLELDLPMQIALTRWPRNGSLSVDRGPLSYSLWIAERWQHCGGDDAWPEWEVFPASAWNYGLEVDPDNPRATISVTETRPVGDQPWTLESAPIELTAQGRRIAGWGLTDETVDPLQDSPIASDAPLEDLTLVPLGCARLRIACFPRIGSGPGAREWKTDN